MSSGHVYPPRIAFIAIEHWGASSCIIDVALLDILLVLFSGIEWPVMAKKQNFK